MPAQAMHRVGDGGLSTFWSIARHYSVTVAQLREWNPGVDELALRVGQLINVSAPVAPEPEPEPEPQPDYGQQIAQLAERVSLLDGKVTAQARVIAALAERVADLEQPAPTPDPEPVPKPVTVWGSSVQPASGEDRAAALIRIRGAYGPPYALRDFDQPGQGFRFPTEYGTALDSVQAVVHSSKRAPTEILAGKWDAEIRRYFDAVLEWLGRDLRRQWRWSWWHECEDDVERGAFTAAQVRATWQHLAAIAAEFRHPRLRSVLILMEFTLRTPNRDWHNYYVPEAQDVLGWDVYDTAANPPIATRLAGIRKVAVETGKPYLIAEAGTSVKYGDRRAKLREFASILATADPRPEIVTYFESDEGHTQAAPSENAWPMLWRPGDIDAWNAGRA